MHNLYEVVDSWVKVVKAGGLSKWRNSARSLISLHGSPQLPVVSDPMPAMSVRQPCVGQNDSRDLVARDNLNRRAAHIAWGHNNHNGRAIS